MEIMFFFQIAAAVFMGCLMTAAFLWAGWTANRLERQGVPQHRLPPRIYLFLLAPLLFFAWMVYELV